MTDPESTSRRKCSRRTRVLSDDTLGDFGPYRAIWDMASSTSSTSLTERIGARYRLTNLLDGVDSDVRLLCREALQLYLHAL